MNPSLCASSCQDSLVDRFPYLPTYLSTLLYVRGSTESSHSHLTRANLCSELQRKRYRPICCERAFELATSEWHASADDTTILIPFHRFRSMPSLRSNRWRLWLTGLYAKTRFLSRTYAVKRITARHLRALFHHHYSYVTLNDWNNYKNIVIYYISIKRFK